MAKVDGLTELEQGFVREYPKDWKARDAAIRAGASPKSAHVTASRMLKNAKVQEKLAEQRKIVTERAHVTQADILQMLSDRATASVARLTEIYRDCCRFCYGQDHLYQETPAERRARYQEHQNLLKVIPEKDWKKVPPFDDMGGVGFDPRKPPHENCPECFGRGEESILVKDTRTMTPGELLAFQGAKRNKAGGVEVKVSDPFRAIDMLGKYHSMWTDGGSGAPTEKVAVMRITREEAEIAKLKPDPEDYST